MYEKQIKPCQCDMVIPADALKSAKFLNKGEATLRVMENMIIVNKPDMTADEIENTVGAYLSLTSALLDEYYNKTGEYLNICISRSDDDDTDSGMGDCDSCEYADEVSCDGTMSIPPCMLEEAGISPDVVLQFFIRDGSILITAADDDEENANE